MPRSRLAPISFTIGAVGPLEGWVLRATWEHFGDPWGPGDLHLDWTHRHGCTADEAALVEMRLIGRACEGNYPTQRLANRALKAAVAAWKTEQDPIAAVQKLVDH